MLRGVHRARTRGERTRHDRGAVAVEFALILPLLAMLLLGIVTFGLTYSNHLALTNTVREGARLGATSANTGTWGASVKARTVDLYADATNPLPAGNVCALLLRKSSSGVTVVESSDAGCAGGTTAAGPVPATPASIGNNTCFVKVWAALPATLNWVVASSNIMLSAKSVAAYDRSLECS